MNSFIARIRDFLLGERAWRELSAIDRSDPALAEALARDLAVGRGELVAIAGLGSRHLALRDRMMGAFGISPRELPVATVPWVRDTAAVCGRCRFKRRCARELQAGTAARNAVRFCPNAAVFEELRRAA